MRGWISIVLVLAFTLSIVPRTLQAAPQAPRSAVEAGLLPPVSSDDPELNSIAQELKSIIHKILNGITVPFRAVVKLLARLWVLLSSYFQQIDTQIQSTKCHDRGCTTWGVPTPK